MPRLSTTLSRSVAPLLLWAGSVCSTHVIAQALTAAQLMDWAEAAYREYFPSRQADQVAAPYVYRYYPETQNYLGVDGEAVYVLGPVSGGALLKVGVLSEFRCRVLPADCAPKTARRLVATNYASMGLTSDGRLFAWGYDPTHLTTPRPVDLAENATARQLTTGVTAAVAHDSGVAVLDSTGKVLGIGHNSGWMGGDLQYSSMKVTSFSPVLFSGRVLAISGAWGSSSRMSALYENGTVWHLPGDATRLNSNWQRFTAKQAIGPSDVVSLSSDGYYAVQRDGVVWRLNTGRDNVRLTNLPPIRDIACGSHCLAITINGTVVAFGTTTTNEPVTTVNLNNVIQVAVTSTSSAALTADGQLWTWGASNYTGQGVAGTTIAAPTPVSGFNNVTDIACGGSHCVVRRRDGSVWGWGTNNYGALGAGALGPSVALGNPFLTPIRATGLILE